MTSTDPSGETAGKASKTNVGSANEANSTGGRSSEYRRGGTDRASRALGDEHEGSFPALEEHKANAEQEELLVLVTPEPLEPLVERLFDLDYLAERDRILEQRAETEREFTKATQRVEKMYGGPVNRVLDRRQDGAEPTFDLVGFTTELDDAMTAIESLRERVDTNYLRRSEQRYLANLESDIVTAREYLRNKREFDDHREKLEPELQNFEKQFEPYKEGTRYMISSDQVALSDAAEEIRRKLRTMARELDLQLLPNDDVEWLSDRKARFGQLAEQLPAYNERLVERQRERYAERFETSHGTLNPSQQKAIVRNDRRNLVDASAGTGKTLTLTYRFLYLIEQGVSVDDIAAVTFTNDAADEMKSRIAAQVDGIDEWDLNILTIHTFANRITRQHRGHGTDASPGEMRSKLAEEFYQAVRKGEGPETFNPADPEAYRRFRRKIQEYYEYVVERDGELPDRGYVVDKLESFLNKAVTFDLEPDEVRARCPDSDALVSAFGRAGAALLSAYHTEAARMDDPIDFQRMIRDAVEVIREHPVELGTRYDHLLVDEFQDVSEVELALFESFLGVGSETHLFCVGDDWQSIYGFRGSDVRIFTGYTDRFEDTTYTSLSVNFRCPPTVVEAGRKLMSMSEVEQNEKAVEADADEDFVPRVHSLDLFDRRGVDYTADLIDDALADGRGYDDVMVISQNDRNSDFLTELREELRSRGVPHKRPDDKNDHVPEWYREELTREVAFDEKGNVEYGDTDQHPDLPSKPPIVTVQSVYGAKGTEAPVVILAPATDRDKDGIPTENRPDGLLAPVEANPADHHAEQRRLFYVALTRTEAEFHAVAPRGQESRFVQELDDHFDSHQPGVTGRCTSITEPENDRSPHRIELDCGNYEVELVGWDDPGSIVEGERYHVPDPVVESNEYGVRIRFDQCDVIPDQNRSLQR